MSESLEGPIPTVAEPGDAPPTAPATPMPTEPAAPAVAFRWWEVFRRWMAPRLWWAVAVGYLCVALAWWGPADLHRGERWYLLAWYVTFMIRTFFEHGGFALLVLAGVALGLRNARAALALVPLLLATLGPAAASYLRSPPAVGATPPALRVMSANLLATNRQTDPLIAEIEAADPDVLLLQEVSDRWHAALNARLAERYPHRIRAPRDDPFGAAIFSKLPFVEPPTVFRRTRVEVPELRAVVRCAGREVVLRDVHLVPPAPSLARLMREQVLEVEADLARETEPCRVVAGDFNFTQYNQLHRRLLATGLSDSQDAAGWGRGTTWPNHRHWGYLPGIRIDHVYHGPGLRPVRCQVGTGTGSDHRPVIVDFAFVEGSSSAAGSD